MSASHLLSIARKGNSSMLPLTHLHTLKLPTWQRLPQQQQHLRYATAMQGGGKRAKQQSSRISAAQHRPDKNVFCLSAIADPYIPQVYRKRQPSLFSTDRVKAWKERIIKFYTKWSTRAMLWRTIGRDQIGMRNERKIALEVYEEMMKAYHAKEMGKLRRFCTERFSDEMKSEMKRRRDVEQWELINVKKVQYVHGFKGNRQLKAINNKVYFVQRTYRIVSDQRVSKPRQGTEQVLENVEEYIVLERNVNDVMSTWRFAGRIDPSKPYVQPSLQQVILNMSGPMGSKTE